MWDIQGFGKKVAEAIDYLEDLDVDVMITFKCILRT
jgi:hypothetical protein